VHIATRQMVDAADVGTDRCRNVRLGAANVTEAACHCGAVRLIGDVAPTEVIDCNCSIRRTLWRALGLLLSLTG
jgi:hypothetical protein